MPIWTPGRRLLGSGVAIAAAALGAALWLVARAPEPAGNPARAAEVVAYWGGWSVGEEQPVHPVDLPVDRVSTLAWFALRYDPATGGCGFGGSANRYQAVERVYPASESIDGRADRPDGRGLRGSWGQLRLLRERHPELRIVATIASPWGSGELAPTVRSKRARQRFVRACVDLVVRGRIPGVDGEYPGIFDGIDIDWEFPDGARQRHGFTLLLRDLRRELDSVRPGSLLTVAALASPHAPDRYELEAIHPYLDWINLMAYDQHGAWDARTNFQAALALSPGLPDHGLTIVETVEVYRAAGVPSAKIVLGVPFYGRGWRGVRPEPGGLPNGLGAPVRCGKRNPTCPARHPVVAGAFGAADYGSLAGIYAQRGVFRDETAQQVWSFDPRTRVFWTSDDPETLRAKASWARAQGLRGVMIWEITQDTDDHALLDALVAGLRNRG